MTTELSTAGRTKMGSAARFPRSIRKRIRSVRAQIWAQFADPKDRRKKLEELYASLGYSFSEKAKKERDKKLSAKGRAKAKRIKEKRERAAVPS